MNFVRILKIGVFLLLNVPVVKYEVFTTIGTVKALFKTHDNVLKNLKLYIDEEEKRLKILKWYKIQMFFKVFAFILPTTQDFLVFFTTVKFLGIQVPTNVYN